VSRLTRRPSAARSSAHQSLAAAGARQARDRGRHPRRRQSAPGRTRQLLEREREQGVAGQDRGGLAEAPVGGGATAAHVIVVERRQVVVHQRECVDALERGRRR